jgi:hypothetical protein
MCTLEIQALVGSQELVAEIMNKTDIDNNKEVSYEEILPW